VTGDSGEGESHLFSGERDRVGSKKSGSTEPLGLGERGVEYLAASAFFAFSDFSW
jgi:hypothetical protein